MKRIGQDPATVYSTKTIDGIKKCVCETRTNRLSNPMTYQLDVSPGTVKAEDEAKQGSILQGKYNIVESGLKAEDDCRLRRGQDAKEARFVDKVLLSLLEVRDELKRNTTPVKTVMVQWDGTDKQFYDQIFLNDKT